MQPSSTTGDPLVGVVLNGRYRVISRLGEGGMGLVYEAEHIVLERRVAVKVLRDECSSRPEIVERFRREARSVTRIGHAHIVDIFDFGETPGGQSYFVMEKLDGEDLADVLSREGSIAPVRAVHIALQCARALGAAHAKGIVHRDMKPENIFLTTRDGQTDFVKIVDFGIAKMTEMETPGTGDGRKLTKTGMIFGTPEYMSPEQAAGKPLDARIDVYALGVILYEMSAGRVPFVGDTFMSILTQHLFNEPPPIRSLNPDAQLSPDLEALIARALCKEASGRVPNMNRFAAELLHVEEAQQLAELYRPEDGDGGFSTARRIMAELGEPADTTYRGGTGHLARLRTEQMLRDSGLKRGRIRWVWPLLALGLAALAGGVWAMSEPAPPRVIIPIKAESGASAAVSEDALAAKTKADASGDGDAQAHETTEDESKANAERPSHFKISLQTKPDSAEIFVEGRGKLCSATPCTFEAPADALVEIVATAGKSSAKTKVKADRDRNITLTLVAQKPPAATQRSSGKRAISKPRSPATSPTPAPPAANPSHSLKKPDFI